MASSLFVSDLHLSEERPEANERFIEFVEGTARAARALYVLGDLFEYWIGDDDLEHPFNAVMAGFFARLAHAGVEVFVMHGNRDFLVGERFCRETGARLLQDPAVLELGGVRTLLMHGDTLCTDDLDYQQWRRTARSEDWQREMLSKPLEERRRAVGALREKSREVIGEKPAEIMDVNEEAVREALRRHGASRLIHGHTHRPGQHRLQVDGMPRERWVLPDWYGRGGYLEVSGSKARLVRW
ncbi:MAG TPA: UDP-2,3-diacylglucosamine diphosphatase [Burkholderiales bacterium]|nr:UDP-2,3-diacylglucosamine diphosphatase [Burkholderiales bacterium]